MTSKTRYMDHSDPESDEEEEDWDKCDEETNKPKPKSKGKVGKLFSIKKKK